jgi:hypothetical protein
MDLYSVILFVHIVGALLVFVLLTVEGLGLRFGFDYARLNRILGPISAAAILLAGLYLMWAQWGWKGWILVGIATYVVIAGLGAYTGISVTRGRMTTRAATNSWLARIGMASAVLFDMTVKPNGLVAALLVIAGAIVGVAVGVVRRRAVMTT